MKRSKAIAVVLTMVLVLGSAATAFAGIDYSQWNSQSAYPADVVGTPLLAPVKALMDRKIITGDSDGLFHPEKNITRAEFATMMAKATNNINDLEGAGKLNIYNDLSGHAWAKSYINACSSAGLIQGVGEGKFAPGKNVSYGELITIVIRTKQGAVSQVESMGTWPDNYIQYAQMYNMLGDIVVRDWNSAATKGDVAKFVYRNMPKSSSSAARVNISPVSTTGAAVNTPITLKAGATGSGSITYEWSVDNVIQWGNNGSTFSFTPTKAGTTYSISVKVTNSEIGKADTTATATATVTTK